MPDLVWVDEGSEASRATSAVSAANVAELVYEHLHLMHTRAVLKQYHDMFEWTRGCVSTRSEWRFHYNFRLNHNDPAYICICNPRTKKRVVGDLPANYVLSCHRVRRQ